MLKQRVFAFLARRLLPRVLTVLRRVTPARPHVIVTGYPAIEGNAVELVRGLTQRYPGRIVWLRHPPRPFLDASRIDTTRVLLADRRHLGTLWRYVTAEAVFFTHGLYGEPAALSRKPTVNVWHGAGPKRMNDGLFPQRRSKGPAHDYLVSISALWGHYYAGLTDLAATRVLVTGHPRNDAMFQADTVERCSSSLGTQFVLWMPAYRSTAVGGSVRGWSDVEGSSTAVLLPDLLCKRLSTHGYEIIVKPHPMDAATYMDAGIRVIDDAWLEAHGFLLGHVMAASAGLITDYSSACTDYVLLERPMGFSLPDLDAYAAGRGLVPADFPDWLPGTNLGSREGIERFLLDLQAGGALTRHERDRFKARAAVNETRAATQELLDALSSGTGSFSARLTKRQAATN